jgi:hypothetical protein
MSSLLARFVNCVMLSMTVNGRCTVREPATDVCQSAAAGRSDPVRHSTDDTDDLLVAHVGLSIIY